MRKYELDKENELVILERGEIYYIFWKISRDPPRRGPTDRSYFQKYIVYIHIYKRIHGMVVYSV